MTGPLALQLDELSVSYLRWGQSIAAVDRVSLAVPEGQWALITGHNGAGKTSLLRAIFGLAPPDGGDIRVRDRPIESYSPRERSRILFMVHQNPSLGAAGLLTVSENLRVADPDGGALGGQRRRQHDELLLELGLESRAKQPAKLLSGGERQLLALGTAKLRRPELLLLDEPFAALDRQKTEVAMGILRSLHQAGCTLVQVAHDLGPVQPHADRLIMMDRGHIVEDHLIPGALSADVAR